MQTPFPREATLVGALALAIAGCGGHPMIVDPTATATTARIISKSAAGGSPELYDYRLKTSDGRSVVVRSADRGHEAGGCVTLGESLHPGWPRIKAAPQAACARITS